MLGFAMLNGTRMTDCSLIMAEFDGAALDDAVFERGLFEGATFGGTNLSRATFIDVKLHVLFAGANLDGCDFARADLTDADLKHALYTPATIWPDGFDPSSRGAWAIGDPGSPDC